MSTSFTGEVRGVQTLFGPESRRPERLGHDGTGLLDLTVLTGAAAASHRPCYPITGMPTTYGAIPFG
jgi:hypothetical protein